MDETSEPELDTVKPVHIETNSQYENCTPSCNKGTKKSAVFYMKDKEEDSKNNDSLLKVSSDIQKVLDFRQKDRFATIELENSMILGNNAVSENYLQSCYKYDFASKSKKGLHDHIAKHHDESNFPCNFCGQKLSSEKE